MSASTSCWVGHLRTYSEERPKGSVDVRSGCPALALNPPCHLVCSRGFSLRGVRLAANLYCKNAFRAGHNPKFSGLIPPLFLTPSLAHKALNYTLLITQEGAGALGGVAGIVEKAVPSLVRCGEFLIILRFESVEKNGRPTVLRLWPGSLSRRDASLLRRYLYFSR